MNSTLKLVFSGVLALLIAASCAGGGSDGGTDSGADGDGSCEFDDSDLTEIYFTFAGSDCGGVGLTVVVDHLYANAELTSFKIAGQFTIDNDNSFYLRGAGVSDGDACLELIENSGSYEVGASYLECTTEVVVDVVTSTDPDATPFCSFAVQTEFDCYESDDDSADDDSGDDDASCEEILGQNVEACFEDFTVEQACAPGGAECWIACFSDSKTCDEWEECLEVDCGVDPSPDDDTDDDADDDTDDDADDDSAGSAPTISSGHWDPDPAADDGSGAIVSTLVWRVCDPEDDLSGGEIFVLIAGTQTPALSGDIFWDDFTEGAPSAPDCGDPLEVGIGVDFSDLVPFGEDVCVDLEVTDGNGNLSNKITNVCVFVP